MAMEGLRQAIRLMDSGRVIVAGMDEFDVDISEERHEQVYETANRVTMAVLMGAAPLSGQKPFFGFSDAERRNRGQLFTTLAPNIGLGDLGTSAAVDVFGKDFAFMSFTVRAADVESLTHEGGMADGFARFRHLEVEWKRLVADAPVGTRDDRYYETVRTECIVCRAIDVPNFLICCRARREHSKNAKELHLRSRGGEKLHRV